MIAINHQEISYSKYGTYLLLFVFYTPAIFPIPFMFSYVYGHDRNKLSASMFAFIQIRRIVICNIFTLNVLERFRFDKM